MLATQATVGQAVITSNFKKRSTSRKDIGEASTILAYCFTDSLFTALQSTDDVLVRSRLPSFLSILAHFPKPKL